MPRVLFSLFFNLINCYIIVKSSNSTSLFNYVNKSMSSNADKFANYPQFDSDAINIPNDYAHSYWPNYTQYNAVYKYTPPYGPTNADNYMDILQKRHYYKYPGYNYALDEKQVINPCTLPQQIGNGPYRIPRWHYNYKRHSCDLFYWSGCYANANNFPTSEECQKQCDEEYLTPNTVVYVPFTLTFVMRPGEKTKSPYKKLLRPLIRIQPAFVEEREKFGSKNNENLEKEKLQALKILEPNMSPSRLKSILPSIRRQPMQNELNMQMTETQKKITFPKYHLSTEPSPFFGPIVPYEWINNNEDYELTSNNKGLFSKISSNPNNDKLGSMENLPQEVGFRRIIPIQKIQQIPQATIAAAVTPQQRLSPTTPFILPPPRNLVPIYPIPSPPILVQPPAQAIIQPTFQPSYEETPNPCAYSGTTALVLCSMPGTICTGDQFCHIGPNREATVCCEKPTIIDPCNQPLNTGVGNANIKRFYYDPTSQQCKSYIYHGYQGNENNFITLNDCQNVCQVNPCARGEPFRGEMGILYCSAMSVCPTGFYCHIGSDTRTSVCCPILGSYPCSQPLETGLGLSSTTETNNLVRWYFDVSQQRCLSFVYAGQKGTQNNFLSKEDCEGFCFDPCRLPVQKPLILCTPGLGECGGRRDVWCHVGATQQTTVCCPIETLQRCKQPPEQGVGEMPSERWYFDMHNSRCDTFIYAGLKGNQNNFMTREECESNCAPNPCYSGSPSLTADARIQTCSMSTALSTCPENYWCHIGQDASTTVCCPNANPTPCRLPMSSGTGSANLERFYFDQTTKTCQSFIYGGFKGNQNNFITMNACQLTCQPIDNPCVGQPAQNPTGQPLFCSSANKDSCPVNFWCHMGANPETTMCCPGATNPCSVPMTPGTGNAGLARWYYNSDDRACIVFQYNGKRGNQNNFLTQVECQRTCPEQLCLLSIDHGACSGQQTRYAYNRQLGECVAFEYSGCGGNLNNFLTLKDCLSTCGNLGF